MEQHTINNQSVVEFVIKIPIQGGYDKVSDFGQEAIIQREKEMKAKMERRMIYFDENQEQMINRL